MPNQDGLQYAAQFDLQSLVLVGSSGQQIDVREIMYELNIFEDLFSNTMTGNLFLSDTQNIINLLPIVGVEHLVVTLVKPSTNWKIEKVFRVYKISNRTKKSAASEDYLLHFCSEEMVLNEGIKISNAYREAKISTIIGDIAYKYLKIDKKKFPQSELLETFGTYNIVLPYWTPFYAINWLSRMAQVSTAKSCSFFFFEDSDGYHFNSLEMLSQQSPIQNINFTPLNMAGETGEQGRETDTEQRLQAAESYEMVRAPNLLRSLSGGQYAGKLLRVNVLDQQVKVSTLDGDIFFNNTKHLNPHPFIQNNKLRTDIPLTKSYESFYRVMVDVNKPESWVLQRNAYITGLHGFQFKVVLPGSMHLRVGKVVNLNMPAASLGTKEKKPMDNLYSGNYLITAIRHKITRTNYACVVELSKDSLKSGIAAPLEHNPAMKRLRDT